MMDIQSKILGGIVIDNKISLRDGYIDIAKGLGIILMVIGHTSNSFVEFIYQFHMPLFFFLSGMVYKTCYDMNPIGYTIKKFKSIYVPYILYNLFFLLIHNVSLKSGIYNYTSVKAYSLRDYFISFIKIITLGSNEELGGVFWFFVALLTTSILFCWIRYFFIRIGFEKKMNIWISLIVGICFIIGYKFELPRAIDKSLVALVFYYVGFIFKQKDFVNKLDKFSAGVCYIVVLIISFFNSVSMGYGEYSNIALFLISSFCGIYATLTLSNVINTKYNINLLKVIGKNTFVISALHFLVFKFINVIIVIIFNLNKSLISSFPCIEIKGVWVIYSIMGVFLPVIINKFVIKRMLRLKFVNKE